MEIEASLIISRDSNNVIRIRVNDDNAVTKFCELELSPHDFAMALTGLSGIKCKAEVIGLDRVGKIRVRESRSVKCPLKGYDKEHLRQWLADNCQEEGWIIDTYLGSQNSINHSSDGIVLNYAVTKYIDAEDEQ